MAGQEHKQRHSGGGDGEDLPEATGAGGQVNKQQLDEDTFAMLDEIDSVLESNSEEFVRGFVQKGGQ